MKDSERPAVLAHTRYMEERNSFAGLNLKQRFTHIHDINLWGADASVSGLGSEADATAVIREALPKLMQELEIQTLLDAPCGDALWISTCDLGVRYIGADIVPGIVNMLKDKAARGEIGGDYIEADITSSPLPKADAILCRDCLVHLSYDNIRRTVANFQSSGAQYLITTTFSDWNENQDIEDGDWRPLNFLKPPFAWPEPVCTIVEQCQEVDGAYRDKTLGVWRLDDVE